MKGGIQKIKMANKSQIWTKAAIVLGILFILSFVFNVYLFNNILSRNIDNTYSLDQCVTGLKIVETILSEGQDCNSICTAAYGSETLCVGGEYKDQKADPGKSFGCDFKPYEFYGANMDVSCSCFSE